MKKINLFLMAIIVMLMASCEKNEEGILETTDTQEVFEIVNFENQNNSNCVIVTGNTTQSVVANETRTFTVSSSISSAFTTMWTQVGGIQILSSPTSRTITVRFPSNFQNGTLSVSLNGSNFSCTEGLNFENNENQNDSSCTRPPNPEWVRSDFFSPVPSEYIKDNLGINYLCTTTIANVLSVPLDVCVDSYTWSISPSGNNVATILPDGSGNSAVVIINNSGRYTVTLRSSNEYGMRIEQFLINAENCDSVGGGSPIF